LTPVDHVTHLIPENADDKYHDKEGDNASEDAAEFFSPSIGHGDWLCIDVEHLEEPPAPLWLLRFLL
jgi:hypothetical protein